MSCRFPGADSPAAFWKLLLEKRDAITEVPADRWNVDELFDPDAAAAGKMVTRWGGFLGEIAGFDAEFFGIAPREAQRMDPQQRLLLETTWEAFENAGVPARSLAGRPVGVFVGIHSMSSDYFWRQAADLHDIDAYTSTGAAHSMAANRLSYLLDLRGPSIAVDTACSSSLVTLHLACQSLRTGECNIAVVAGVNLMLSPEGSVALSKLRAMAPDGRCKTFDASADGFVRGEGCGVVVLRRLDDALEHGDPVMAIIRGSAVNQDGATNGLTAPNGLAQREVVRQALRDANVRPERITLVETHGTGTVLGDPIEIEALSDVLGRRDAAAAPCVLGAVKTNIGHLESAAGIAGLIKVVLCLQHRYIPANLHFRTLNPHLSLESTRFIFPGDGLDWQPQSAEPRLAAVSSFGMGGTNAHVVLEEFVAGERREASDEDEYDAAGTLLTLPLSARTPDALRTVVRQTFEWLDGPDGRRQVVSDVAYSAGVRRDHYEYRHMFVGRSRGEWHDALERFLKGEPAARRVPSPTLRPWPGVVFVYSGQGPQWPGMGRQLHATQPVFRDALDRCEAEFRRHAPWSLLEELNRPEETSRLQDTEIAQPAIFAIQYALTELSRAWGITADAVVGHSAGEVAAAWAAGGLRFEDAARLVVHRGRLMECSESHGAMAAVELPAHDLRAEIASFDGQLELAAMNSPTSSVLSGEPDAISRIVATLKDRGVFAKVLGVKYAFHSRQMERLQPELVKILSGLVPADAAIPIASTVTGQIARPGEQDATYWARNMREPVRFAAAVQALAAAGQRVFLELSPHPILGSMLARCTDQSLIACGTLRRGEEEERAMLQALASLYEAGLPVDFSRFHTKGGKVVPLPVYPWQRTRFWFSASPARSRHESGPAIHPLLGRRASSALPLFECAMSAAGVPLAADHRVLDRAVLPAAAYIEMIRAAAVAALGSGSYAIAELAIAQALVLPDEGERTVQISVSPDDNGGATVRIFSRSEADAWTAHAAAKVRAANADQVLASTVDLSAVRSRCGRVAAADHYARLADRQLFVGPTFDRLEQLWVGDGEALGRVRSPGGAGGVDLDPVWLDACLQALVAAAPTSGTYLLGGIDGLAIGGRPAGSVWSYATLEPAIDGGRTISGSLRVVDDDGSCLLRADGIVLRQLTQSQDAPASEPAAYHVEWRPAPIAATAIDAARADASPSAPRLAAAVAEVVEPLRAAHNLQEYEELLPELESLSVACVIEAFHELGWRFEVGQRTSIEELAATLGIVPAQRRLFARVCGMLEEEGYLGEVSGRLEATRCPERPSDVRERCAALRRAYPGCRSELDLMERCGPQLGGVLCGKIDAVQILFPNGSFEAVERLYRDSPYSRVDNTLLQHVVARAVADWPPDRALRILEIGAGTGGSTTYVVRALPRDRTEYVFTDVSQLFLVRARQRFSDTPSMRYEILDIERSPAEQGFAGREFDIVIAANVLHATADLRRTLAHVRQLLAPEGLLLLLEVTRPQRWIDLTFGLTEGWWRFTDLDLRPRRALLTPPEWLSLLDREGLELPAAIPDPASHGSQESILVARAPASTGKKNAAIRWLILADRSGTAAALADRIRADGGEPVIMDPGPIAEVARFLATLPPGVLVGGAIHLRALDLIVDDETSAARVTSDQEQLAVEIVELGQVLSNVQNARLWIVTRGAQAVASGEPAPRVAVAQASVWGLGRVMALEWPESWGGLIDVDGDPATIADRVATEVRLAGCGEDQIAWRGTTRYVPRLLKKDIPQSGAPLWKSDGAYLISGGLGGVGLLVAKELAARGVRHVVLIGRTAIDEPAMAGDAARRLAGVEELRDLGVEVTVEAMDVGDEAAMAAFFHRCGWLSGDARRRHSSASDLASLPPLRGVFHAAARVDSVPLLDMTAAAIGDMYQPKIGGAWTLHRLTRDLDLDHFVLFSSTTALLGAAGLAHYAAANCFLDALAHYRHAHALPALSVNWGTWEVMRSFSGEERAEVERHGLHPIRAEVALSLLDRARAAGSVQVAIADVDWSVLKPVYEARRPRPFLRELGNADLRPSVRSPRGGADLRTRLLATAPSARYEIILEAVRRTVVGVLGYAEDRPIDVRQGLFDLGIDSLMSVELRTRLGALAGTVLPAALTFNYPNIEALAVYLLDALDLDELSAGAAPAATPVPDGRPFAATEGPRSIEDTLALLDAEMAAIDALVRD